MEKQEKNTYPIKKNEVKVENKMDEYRMQKLDKEKNRIAVSDAIRIDDKIWFMSDTFNGLFCMEIASQQIEFIGSFPNEPYSQRFLYSAMERVGTKIYFAPYFAKNIAVYDMKNCMFEEIEIAEELRQSELPKDLFYGMQRYNNFLFFIPAYGKAIIRLNSDNNEVQYMTEWMEKADVNFDRSYKGFGPQRLLRENKLFVPFHSMNSVLEIDCDTFNCVIHRLNVDAMGFSGICDDGEKIWLYSMREGDLIGWNPNSNEIVRVKIFEEGIQTSWDKNCRMIYYNNKIMIFWVFENHRKMRENVNFVMENKAGYMFAREEEDYIIFCERNTSLLTIIDKKNKTEHKIEMSSNNKIMDMWKVIREKGVFTEIQEFTIKNYLDELLRVK